MACNRDASSFSGCPIQVLSVATIDQVLATGGSEAIANAQGAQLGAFAACGEHCSNAGYCLANNSDGSDGAKSIDSYLRMFITAGVIDDSSVTPEEAIEEFYTPPHTRYFTRF